MAFTFLVILWFMQGGFALFCLYRFGQFVGQSGAGGPTRSMLKLAGACLASIFISMAVYHYGMVYRAMLIAGWPLFPIGAYLIFVGLMMFHRGRWN